jgi:hypothetical protein
MWSAAFRDLPERTSWATTGRGARSTFTAEILGNAWGSYPQSVDGCVEINYNGATGLGLTAVNGDRCQGGASWHGNLASTRVGMRGLKRPGVSGSYHASLGEVMSVNGCAEALWMNCAITPRWPARCQGPARRAITGPPPFTSKNADGPGLREGSGKGFRPDSYPHVTCEYTVTEQRDLAWLKHVSLVPGAEGGTVNPDAATPFRCHALVTDPPGRIGHSETVWTAVLPWPARTHNAPTSLDATDSLNLTTDQKVGGSSPSERATSD